MEIKGTIHNFYWAKVDFYEVWKVKGEMGYNEFKTNFEMGYNEFKTHFGKLSVLVVFFFSF